MLTKPALEALTDQAFAATADSRDHHHPATIADAGEIAERLAEQFRGDEAVAGAAVMTVAMILGPLVARYEQFPGGTGLIPVVLAVAAEQVVREAGAA